MHVARGGGPGGQKRNVTESAVRLRHRPSGLMVRCDETRSQRRNLELALTELARRIELRTRKPKPRKKSRVSLSAKRRRLEGKRRKSTTKQLRGKVTGDS